MICYIHNALYVVLPTLVSSRLKDIGLNESLAINFSHKAFELAILPSPGSILVRCLFKSPFLKLI